VRSSSLATKARLQRERDEAMQDEISTAFEQLWKMK